MKKLFILIKKFFTSDFLTLFLWLSFSVGGFIEVGRAAPVYDSICSGVIPSNYLDICGMYTSGIFLGIGLTYFFELVISLLFNCFSSSKKSADNKNDE